MTALPRLHVPLMDRDHAAIAELLQQTAAAADPAAAFGRIAAAIAEHFAGEEALMRQADIPILHCHLDLHAFILGKLARARQALEAGRRGDVDAFLRDELPGLIADHVASADTVSAGMLRVHFGDVWERAPAS